MDMCIHVYVIYDKLKTILRIRKSLLCSLGTEFCLPRAHTLYFLWAALE